MIYYHKESLFQQGCDRVTEFCKANKIVIPSIASIEHDDWFVSACAYYRPKGGINICQAECARLATDREVRNWNWPGSVTDREPYGVLCHELGHHCDWLAGDKPGTYYSEYSTTVMKTSGEAPITSYAPNPAEWFAEIFRLFVTNHALLYYIRPKTWEILRHKWEPVSNDSWEEEIGNAPDRIMDNLRKKIKRGK